MTDTERLIWGTFASLLVALVVVMITWLAKKSSDKISLKANLEATVDINILNTIGCAGLILTVMCKGKRVAKIKESCISLVTDHEVLESFGKGFDFPLGQGYSSDLPAPKLIVKLIPLSKSSNNGAYILERDDVCKFMLPILLPKPISLEMFTKAPSENVSICVKYLNGDETTLMKGLDVQEKIHDLIDIHGNLPMNLKVQLSIKLQTSTTTPPDSSGIIGKVNPNPVEFRSRSDRE